MVCQILCSFSFEAVISSARGPYHALMYVRLRVSISPRNAFAMLLLFLLSNRLECKPPKIFLLILMYQTLPARPAWIISPVCLSSALSTGQPSPSAFARVNSSFVPIILKALFSVSIVPNKGMLV